MKTIKEATDKEINELKKKVFELEMINKEQKPQIENLNIQLNDVRNKYEQKLRELDKIREEQKKKEKSNEDKLNLLNCKNNYIQVNNRNEQIVK